MKATFTLVEMPAPAITRSTEFLQQVFGWEVVNYGEQYSDVFFAPGQSLAFQAGLADAEPAPLPVFEVDDLDQARREIEQAGGRVTVEPFDFPGGRRFHFAEPSGNILAVWVAASS